MAGSWREGLREVWAHPWLLLRDATVRIGSAHPVTGTAARSPSLGERELRAAAGDGRERWTAAAAHAACVWDVSVATDAPVEASATADFRVAGAAPPAVQIERTGGGLRVTRSDGPAMEMILARGDVLDADGARISARGRGAVRIIIVAGCDASDLARARDRIERRGLAAVAGERAQHARLVADFGVAIDSVDPAAVAAFEWAKVAADGLLIELPGGARRFAEAYREPDGAGWRRDGPIVWASGRSAASLGAALLSAGLREPVRDALRSGAPGLAAGWHDWTGEATPGREAADATDAADAGGAADAGPGGASAAWAPIADELFGRWGARARDGAALSLRPTLPADRREMAVRRLRIGNSVMDAELRRRFDRVIARFHRRHGPPLPVAIELAGAPPVAVSADDVPMPGARAVVTLSDRHEVLFQF
jgi:hypothetical protein